ncbi:MAG: M23 family metallopeptidase [Lachnospiraceae bacterium]
MDTNNTNTDQTIYKYVLVTTDEKGKKRFCFQVPFLSFWIGVLIICVVLGCIGGALLYGSNLVMNLGEEAVEESKRYLALQDEYKEYQNTYKELELVVEDLNTQITVLSDTIAQNKADTEMAVEQALQDATPTGFPVTGTVTEAETPEEAIAFEPAIYLEGSEGAVVVATGNGEVSKISTNAYGNTEIYIDHGNGFQTVYVNAAAALIGQGSSVYKGTPLFLIGEENTLIKYQITVDAALVDPYSVMVIEG